MDLSERYRARRRHGCRQRLVVVLSVLLVLGVGGWLMLEPILRAMLYPAPAVPVGEPPPGLEEVVLEGLDGAPQVGWASPGPGGGAGATMSDAGRAGGDGTVRPSPALLVLHGNGENLATMALSGSLQQLAALGGPFLALDYPGYGRSQGEPEEASLVAGAEAGLAWLRRRHPQRPVVLVGWSLGAGVAMQVAAREADGGRRLDGLVLLSPWSRLADAAAAHMPGLLVRPVAGRRYDSVAAAARTSAPALVIHGARDRIIPMRQGRELAAALEARPDTETRWVEIPTAGHNDLLAHREPWREMAIFLEGPTTP